MADGESIHLAIVREVAAFEGVHPVELTPPLHEAVDTDALDALVRSSCDVSIEFVYGGYGVLVEGPGRVTVRERTAAADGDQRLTDD